MIKYKKSCEKAHKLLLTQTTGSVKHPGKQKGHESITKSHENNKSTSLKRAQNYTPTMNLHESLKYHCETPTPKNMKTKATLVERSRNKPTFDIGSKGSIIKNATFKSKKGARNKKKIKPDNSFKSFKKLKRSKNNKREKVIKCPCVCSTNQGEEDHQQLTPLKTKMCNRITPHIIVASPENEQSSQAMCVGKSPTSKTNAYFTQGRNEQLMISTSKGFSSKKSVCDLPKSKLTKPAKKIKKKKGKKPNNGLVLDTSIFASKSPVNTSSFKFFVDDENEIKREDQCRKINDMTLQIQNRDAKIKLLEDKIKEMEKNHIEEIKKLNQLYSQKENQRQKSENSLKNRIMNLEIETQQKSLNITNFLEQEGSQISSRKRCDECERLRSIIIEMENQIESYKKSILRKENNVKTSSNYGHSYLKSYIKDIENDNLELESLLLDHENDLQSIRYNQSPLDRQDEVTKVSFITLSQPKAANDTSSDADYILKASPRVETPDLSCSKSSKMPSNNSEAPKYTKFSIDCPKRNQTNKASMQEKSF
ncbi:unnamed protein product [Moneuplotes crassus]|uniref:Uncharacterized protein n=1 Tax=Euplotes crassus TaxID=5936 RepID=A0AAD1X6A1_EUPCR|nr:unnamed protein product [Moneuplotes crassus]